MKQDEVKKRKRTEKMADIRNTITLKHRPSVTTVIGLDTRQKENEKRKKEAKKNGKKTNDTQNRSEQPAEIPYLHRHNRRQSPGGSCRHAKKYAKHISKLILFFTCPLPSQSLLPQIPASPCDIGFLGLDIFAKLNACVSNLHRGEKAWGAKQEREKTYIQCQRL